MPAPLRAVTFDFGQTLCELDGAMLSARLCERAVRVPAAALDREVAGAFRAYDDAVRAGESGHPWKLLMRTLLARAGAPAPRLGELVDWLWDEQPRRNLWRRPIPGMLELVDDLRAAGLALGVVSNSEGGLAALVEELGWAGRFCVIADSGVLGFEKPGREIFAWAAERLGVPLASLAHVGDSAAADVAGALGAGAHAVLFRGDAAEARHALSALGAAIRPR
jgi:putative hydrolase of the HAD superfamily